MFEFNRNETRVAQSECLGEIEAYLVRWRDAYDKGQPFEEEVFCGVVPARYGKSAIMHTAGIWWDRMFPGAFTVAASPDSHTRAQLADGGRWNRLEAETDIRPQSITNFDRHFDGRFLSATIQLLHTRRADLEDWVYKHIRDHSAPPLFLIDECHRVGDGNEWDKVLQLMRRLGCPVLAFSATPYRTNKRIAGIRYQRIGEKSTEQLYRVDAKTLQRDTYLDEMFEVHPHYSYEFSDAWGEDPSPLVTVGRHWVDVEVRDTNNVDRDAFSISEAKPTVAKESLGRWVRQRIVYEPVIRDAVELMDGMLKADPTARAIVFAAPASQSHDNGELDQTHVEKLRTELEAAIAGRELLGGRPWTVETADAGEQIRPGIYAAKDRKAATTKLEAFCDPQNTSVQFLILKSMGSVGLDAPACKMVVDLSSRRQAADWIQRAMRGATSYGQWSLCIHVGPDDSAARANWNRLTGGGEFGKTIERTLINEDELLKPQEKSKDKPHYVADSSLGCVDVADTLGGFGKYTQAVMEFFAANPWATSLLTEAQVAEAIIADAAPDEETKEVEVDKVLKQLREDTFAALKRVTQARLSKARAADDYVGDFKDVSKQVATEAKRFAGLAPTKCKNDFDCYSIKEFRLLLAAGKHLLKNV